MSKAIRYRRHLRTTAVAAALTTVLGLGLIQPAAADDYRYRRDYWDDEREVHVYHHDRDYRDEREVHVYHHYPSRPRYGRGHGPGPGYGARPTFGYVAPYRGPTAAGLLGAAAGGYLGSELSHGKPAATAAGAVGGYIFGDYIGQPYYRY